MTTKRTDLTEMPMYRPETITAKVDDADADFRVVSAEALTRDFKPWGQFNLHPDMVVSLYRRGKHCYGFMTTKVRGKTQNNLVFTLVFYDQVQIANSRAFTKALQVMKVDSARALQSFGLASMVYRKLCDDGYTIISDNEQYEGGKRLWTKLLKEAPGQGYAITVYDEMNDREEQYDAQKAGIYWDQDYDGKDWLFVMRKKR